MPGIPMADVDARVIDLETLRETLCGATGEIVIDGFQVMHAYWRQPEATHESSVEMDDGRYLRTGDLGYIDEDGLLHGRSS